MADSPDFSSQAADKDFWAQDKLDSEQRMLQVKPQEGVLPPMLAQKKGHAKPKKRPMVNQSVAGVIAKKVHKTTAFMKPKARMARQAIQVESGAGVDGAHAASPI